MTIRRDVVTRVNEARRAFVPTIGRGKPSNSQGNEGDITARRIKDSYRLFIKANGKWHGVKIGEGFDSLEKKINDINSKINLIRDFTLPATYSVIGDFTLDSSGDISLDADGGEIYFKDGGTTFGNLSTNGSYSSITLYEDGGASSDDYFQLYTGNHGATTIRTVDAAGTAGNITLLPDGDLKLDPGSQKIIINATDSLYFDGGNDTRIYENAADSLRMVVGGVALLAVVEDATTSAAQSSYLRTGCALQLKDLGGVSDTPASGYGNVYVNSDVPYFKDDGGSAHLIHTGWHGSTTRIKFFPHQFVEHEGTAGRQFAVVEDDVSGKLGVRVTNTSAIMFSWIAIPTGYTATALRCYADTGSNLDVQCWSTDIDDGDITDIGSGDASAEVNITDVASTTTNSIIVRLTFANTSTEFYGGYITIAAS
jgi:hypothetical protein